MRYVFIKEIVAARPEIGVSVGTVVYLARLRKDIALASILLGTEPNILRSTDPRLEWAKTAGKCPNACTPENPPWHLIPCNCDVMTRARLMLREIDRKVTA